MKWLTNNWGWKLLSLGGSVLLWLALAGDQQLTFNHNTPVTYKGIRAGLEIGSDVPESVVLELNGPSRTLERIAETRSTVVFDFGAVASPGERTFDIDARAVTLPKGVRMVRSVPSQLRFRFERRVARRIPVRIRTAGQPPEGLQVIRQEVVPDTLTVVGPESRVAGVDSALTDSVDLGLVAGAREFPVNTFVGEPHVRFESSSRVTVRVETGRK